MDRRAIDGGAATDIHRVAVVERNATGGRNSRHMNAPRLVPGKSNEQSKIIRRPFQLKTATAENACQAAHIFRHAVDQ
ncbi:hypothetical protein BJS_02229 [Bradyrhizobium japonicum SEMIA 5079]|nr:hypothetical protein BJS_02229 [Bradyrhizobium japonicum SEMIA 5079]